MATFSRLVAGALAALALLVVQACGDPNCKNACDKLKSCGLSSSGFSCDAACKAPDDACAVCVNDSTCGDVESGACKEDCTQARFSR